MNPEPLNGMFPLLSLLVWLPIIGGLVTLAFGETRANGARWFATGVAAATLAASVLLFTGFDLASPAMQFVEKQSWIRESWTETGSVEECLEDFAGWHADIHALIRQLDNPLRVADVEEPDRTLLQRVSLFGPTPRGIRLLSDVTTSDDENYRPAGVSRLVSALVRAARA